MWCNSKKVQGLTSHQRVEALAGSEELAEPKVGGAHHGAVVLGAQQKVLGLDVPGEEREVGGGGGAGDGVGSVGRQGWGAKVQVGRMEVKAAWARCGQAPHCAALSARSGLQHQAGSISRDMHTVQALTCPHVPPAQHPTAHLCMIPSRWQCRTTSTMAVK